MAAAPVAQYVTPCREAILRGDTVMQHVLTGATGAAQLALIIVILAGHGDLFILPIAATTLVFQTGLICVLWRGSTTGHLSAFAWSSRHMFWFGMPFLCALVCRELGVVPIFLAACISSHVILFFSTLLAETVSVQPYIPEAWFAAAVCSVYGSLRAGAVWGERHGWYSARVSRLVPAAAALAQTLAMIIMQWEVYRFGYRTPWFVAYATSKTTLFLLLPYMEETLL
jgi:hypothetical protein